MRRWHAAPSPKKQTVTRSCFWYFEAKPNPAASGIWPAHDGVTAHKTLPGDPPKCIDPLPWPEIRLPCRTTVRPSPLPDQTHAPDSVRGRDRHR